MSIFQNSLMRLFRRGAPEPEIPPQWLVVGLGNPGPEYRGTRHNVGFDVIDLLASKNRIKLNRGMKKGLVGTGLIEGVPVMLVKPMTFMNLSGQAVAPLAKQAGLKPERVLVVADDLDLAVGVVKMRLNGSAGGHNGHKSLIASLQSQEYPRIKIGIGKGPRGETINHVLGGFNKEDRAAVDEAIEASAEACELAVGKGVEGALNFIAEYNRRRQHAEDLEG